MVDGTPLQGLNTSLTENAVATERLGTEMVAAEASTKKFGGAVGFLDGQLRSVKAAFTSFLGAFIGFEAIKSSVDAFNTMQQALAQIDAGLKSTGDASGYTRDQLEQMADQLERTSTFNRADILKNVTSQLLTFSNVSGDTFRRAQQDIIDYAARTGRDLRGASIQIGRALNSPAQSLGMLTRLGIQFNAEQKKTIDGLVKTGNAAQAQAMILDVLEQKYQGSASAAAKAGLGPLVQFKNTIIDLSESIGGFIVSILNPLAEGLDKLINFFQENSTFAKIFAVTLGSLALAIGIVKEAEKGWTIINTILEASLWPILLPILAVIAIATALSLAIQDLWVYLHGGDSVIGRLIDDFDRWIDKHQELKAILEVVGAVFKLVWATIKLGFEEDVMFIEKSIDFLINKFNEFMGIVDKVKDKLEGAFDSVKSFFGDSSQTTNASIQTASNITGFLNGLTTKLNAQAAIVGTQTGVSTSVNNTTHAPVVNNNVTVHTTGSPEQIARVVTKHLDQHYKAATRAFDSNIAR